MSQPTPPPAVPAGWYPDGSVGQERYWDGAAWTQQVRDSSAPAIASDAAGHEDPAPAGGYPVSQSGGERVWDGAEWIAQPAEHVAEPTTKKSRKKLFIGGGVAAALLLFIIVGSVNAASNDADEVPVAAVTAPAEEVDTTGPVEETEPVKDTRAELPNLIGMTVSEARADLTGMGLVLAVGLPDDAVIETQAPAAGEKVEPNTEVSITGAVPPPPLSLAQQNVIEQAKSYLRFSGFSRAGLIDQLEYEGYSVEDATFGADNASADWNAEAAEKAASYLETSSFSRDGLYDQMAYEEFTEAEILHALASVGY